MAGLVLPPWRRAIAVGLLGLLGAAALVGVELARQGGDATVPFRVGQASNVDDWLRDHGVAVTTTPDVGYDGQFYLGLAHDPLLRRGVAGTFDAPRYRASRPLYAWVGWLLAGGRARAVAAGLLAAGLLAAGLGCACTAWLLEAQGVTRWAGLLFCWVPGVVVALVRGTAEPLGLALAMLAVALVAAGRLRAAGAALAAATLTKETYLVFGVAAVLWLLGRGGPARRQAHRAVVLLAPSLLAFGAWSLYVATRAPARPTDHLPYAAFATPLRGWLAALAAAVTGRYRSEISLGGLVPLLLIGLLLLILAGVWVGVRDRSLPARLGLVLGVYGLALSPSADRLLSSTRILAPSALAGLVALAAALGGYAGRSSRRSGRNSSRPPSGSTRKSSRVLAPGRNSRSGTMPAKRAGSSPS